MKTNYKRREKQTKLSITQKIKKMIQARRLKKFYDLCGTVGNSKTDFKNLIKMKKETKEIITATNILILNTLEYTITLIFVQTMYNLLCQIVQ